MDVREQNEEYRHRGLVTGLVGDYRDLYLRSASFRHQIDILAGMLPLMVDGLAAQAERTDRQIQQAVEAAEMPPRWRLDDK
jgi:hypothetical protein